MRLRHPRQMPIRSVIMNGKDWKGFHPGKEIIDLLGVTGKVVVVAGY